MAKEIDKPNIENRQFTLPVELRVSDDGKVKILVGYAAVFNSITDIGWFREQIAPGCFADSLQEDDIRGLFNHDPNLILGRNKAKTCTLKEDKRGLYFEIDVPDTQVGRDVATSVKRGDVSGCSFSFSTLADSWDYSDEEHPLRTLQKVRLYDIGPVTFPAYPDTSVAARSLEAFKTTRKAPETPENRAAEPQNSEKPPENGSKSAVDESKRAQSAETDKPPTARDVEYLCGRAQRVIDEVARRRS